MTRVSNATGWFVMIAAAVLAIPAPASDPSSDPSITLTTQGADGAAVVVDGIVCDNLRDTPEEQQDRLDIRLPAPFSEQLLSASVANPDATTTDSDGHGNVGAIVAHNGHLAYFPPAEFNRRQEPRGLRDLDAPATRIVLLTVRAQAPGGGLTVFVPRPIVLARPPVELIHGINRGPGCWIPLIRAVAALRGDRGRNIEIPFTAVDHFAPPSYAGANLRDRAQYPEGLFFGSGPVEIGAELLARHIERTRRRVLAGEPIPFIESSLAARLPEPFIYRYPGSTTRPAPRLAIRRVDVIGWSYGGVIARWYLASPNSGPPLETYAYRGGYVLRGPDGKPLDLCPGVEYGHDVRKLITLGSMWRGVPLINYLNEIRFSDPSDPESLARAPLRLPQWMPRSLWKETGAGRTIGSLADAIDSRIRVKSPAMEVMAIDSPWMSFLIYGTADSTGSEEARPFRDEVAYGSVAGDSSAYLAFGPLSSISPYGALPYFQMPVRFPYLALERRGGIAGSLGPLIGSERDYTDGLVPLWSAVIPGAAPGASRIVHATHDMFFTNSETLEYISRWLNNAALPTGRTLRPQWNSPVVSRDGRKRWQFRAREMAPESRNALYARIGGIGRIAPSVLHPERSIVFRRESDSAVRVEWNIPGGGFLHQITLYELVESPENGGQGTRKALGVFTPAGGEDNPHVILDGLRTDRTYFIVAEAIVENGPDPPVIVKSGSIEVPYRH